MMHVEAADAMTGEAAIEGFVTFATWEESGGRKKEHGIALDGPKDEREAGLRARAMEVKGRRQVDR